MINQPSPDNQPTTNRELVDAIQSLLMSPITADNIKLLKNDLIGALEPFDYKAHLLYFYTIELIDNIRGMKNTEDVSSQLLSIGDYFNTFYWITNNYHALNSYPILKACYDCVVNFIDGINSKPNANHSPSSFTTYPTIPTINTPTYDALKTSVRNAIEIMVSSTKCTTSPSCYTNCITPMHCDKLSDDIMSVFVRYLYGINSNPYFF